MYRKIPNNSKKDILLKILNCQYPIIVEINNVNIYVCFMKLKY